MHDHMMDTSETPTPTMGEGVNGGALVITTTLESPNLNTKILHVTPVSSSEPQVLNCLPNHGVVSSTAPSAQSQAQLISSTIITPFPQSSSVVTAVPITQNNVPRPSQNENPNCVASQINVPNHKISGLTVVQNSLQSHNHVNHSTVLTNHQSSLRSMPTTSLPNFTKQPSKVSIENRNFNMQNQVTIQGSFIHLQQRPLLPPHSESKQQPASVSFNPPRSPSSVIHSLPQITVVTPTTNGLPEGIRHQRFSNCHPPLSLPSADHQIKAMTHQLNITSPPLNIGQTSISSGGTNGQAKQSSENKIKYEDDSSDTDMEIKSLDLTSLVNNAQKGEKERERPMSWEGELSDLDLKKHEPQEEQMRVENEEPMSPMSPVSHSSDNDQEPLSQIKCEDVVDDHQNHHAVFTSHILPSTDSPVPARSDSGCELHLGPFTPTQSPLLPRIHSHQHSPTHLYSPTQSPSQSRHLSGFSSPYSHSPSTGLSRNNSDASQYGGSYNSYSSAPSPISPTHYSPSQSPNLGRITGSIPGGGSNHGCFLGGPIDLRDHHGINLGGHHDCGKDMKDDERLSAADLAQHSVLAAQSGITRQQLINSPCPICGDKISGFHYGIFSCESCKGFFKRTVQNKKNYVCMRGSSCPVSITTRKKCPACRFEKCLRKGMKLEAIREDRTRGGRSTYQCAPYTLPPSLVSPSSSGISLDQARISDGASVKSEPQEGEDVKPSSSRERPSVPILLQQIHDVEHLWHCSEAEMSQIRQADAMAREAMESDSSDCVNMCKIAEGRLYKIVKWCKSLPLFRHISIDDQIILLMNSWCELLLLSCCFRSMDTPGEIKVSSGKTMTLAQAESMGIGPCIERMLNLSYQLRRLQVDRFEYMAMKVIVLLTSDVAGLKEGEKVRYSQEKVVQALQEYTLSHYPHLPSKFGELLLRIPELQRTCHASKEMLSVKKKEGDVPSFNFLFELLRGDH